MEFTLSAEQAELAATVRAVLDRQADPGAVRAVSESDAGFDPRLWGTLCEQVGVAALLVPEQHDGVGVGFLEAAVVLEELGRSLAPTPFLAGLLATEALLAGGAEEAQVRLLPRIAAGAVATVVIDDHPALDVDDAEIVLALRGDDLVELTDARSSWTPSMDQTLRLGTVDLAAASTTVVGDGVAARARLSLVGPAAVAALAVGTSERGLRMCVEHTSSRVQFGRPIGSFQALKHRMADLLARTEMARSASWAASYRLGMGGDAVDDDAAFAVRAAASFAQETVQQVAAETVQLHGGIAITWEHDAHRVFKRAHALGQLFGTARDHRAAVRL